MNVLLVENDPLLVEDYKEITESLKINLIPFGKGLDALKYIESNYMNIAVYIFDLKLDDDYDGNELIRIVKSLSEDNIVIVQTGNSVPQDIIKIMKNRIFDYLIKPISPSEIEKKLLKALDFKQEIDIKKKYNKSSVIKLQEYIHWLNFKDSATAQGSNSHERKLIYNLKTSLSQGSGIGATISIIDMIESTAKLENNQYVVDKEVMTLLFGNNKASKIVINSMEKMLNLLDSSFTKEEVDVATLFANLKTTAESLRDYMLKKHISFVFSDTKEAKINVDIEKVTLALNELLINSAKYSQANSKIFVMINLVDGYARFSFRNTISNEEAEQINHSKSSLGTPFFRIHPPVEDICENEQLSFGSGIMAVEYIIKKNFGIFTIDTFADYTGKIVNNCVIAEAMFECVE